MAFRRHNPLKKTILNLLHPDMLYAEQIKLRMGLWRSRAFLHERQRNIVSWNREGQVGKLNQIMRQAEFALWIYLVFERRSLECWQIYKPLHCRQDIPKLLDYVWCWITHLSLKFYQICFDGCIISKKLDSSRGYNLLRHLHNCLKNNFLLTTYDL